MTEGERTAVATWPLCCTGAGIGLATCLAASIDGPALLPGVLLCGGCVWFFIGAGSLLFGATPSTERGNE